MKNRYACGGMDKQTMTVEELAQRIGAQVRGDGKLVIGRCAAIDDADGESVTFVANQKYARLLRKTEAGAAIVGPGNVERAREGLTLLVAEDPYFAFRQAVVILHGFRTQPQPGISKLAYIDPSAKIGKDCAIQPFVFVGPDAVIGDGCVLYAGCYVGEGSTVGEQTVLYAGVVVYEGCRIGKRVILHAGTVIGTDGYGFATHKGAHHKIPQFGNVVLEDDVELGANCAVQRGAVGPTVIGAGTKMSDLVDIGHGATVGKHNLLVSQVGIAGSATTGDYVVIGGQSGVAGHLQVGRLAQVAARSGVVTDVPEGEQYGGSPAIRLEDAKKVGMEVVRLPEIVKEMRELQERVKELEKRLGEG
ncbi:MAG: UDP-3-O-(3-hydroxymyristoyl)glucosamine N-acyltransferase [Phycisphaeraceae bacterium]|nr:UDP-3-O-(3-hydroxymyristoyl)glucosamine N-acyltransferase [Phycisphaeraceae bacterium]